MGDGRKLAGREDWREVAHVWRVLGLEEIENLAVGGRLGVRFRCGPWTLGHFPGNHSSFCSAG